MTHDSLSDLWLATMRSRGLSTRTIDDRRRILTNFARTLGITPETAGEDDVIEWLSRDIAQSSREHYWSTLRVWFAWLQDRGLIDVNPIAAIRRPRVPPALPKPAAKEHIRRVLNSSIRRTTRTKIIMAVYAGMRVSEIAAFRGEYLDQIGETIRILGKGGRDDVLPVHRAILEEASLYPAGYWFPSPGQPDAHVSGNSVSTVISRAFRRIGVRVTAHRLRHHFATSLLEQGIDSRIVQTLMRHSSLATTGRYLKVLERQQRHALDALHLM